MMHIEEWKKIPPGSIVATGIVAHDKVMPGFDYTDSVCIVVKKGQGYDDWCIYYAPEQKGFDWTLAHGTKVFGKEIIKELFPCDDEVLDLYRR